MTAVGQVRPAVRQRVAPDKPGPQLPARPPLRVVPPTHMGMRARRRRTRLLVSAFALLIALGMFAIVGAQVFLTQRQLHLDQMSQSLSEARMTNDQLALQVATLESPSRIVSEAESRLHMVTPPKVAYLAPQAKAPAPVKGVSAPAPTGAPG